ncbi:MAG: AbrB family transcriptional regulator [bacterium]
MQDITIKSDERGRICLGKKIVEKYGTEFIIIPTSEQLILLPKTEDPIKELQKQGEKLPALSRKKLRKKILKEAFKSL